MKSNKNNKNNKNKQTQTNKRKSTKKPTRSTTAKSSSRVENEQQVGCPKNGSVIDGIIDICVHNNEEYALVTYADKNFDPKWHPTRNLINADHLVEEYRRIEESAARRAAQRNHQEDELSSAHRRLQAQKQEIFGPNKFLTDDLDDQESPKPRKSPKKRCQKRGKSLIVNTSERKKTKLTNNNNKSFVSIQVTTDKQTTPTSLKSKSPTNAIRKNFSDIIVEIKKEPGIDDLPENLFQSSLERGSYSKKKNTYDEQFGLLNNEENESSSFKPSLDTWQNKPKRFKAVHYPSNSLKFNSDIPDVPVKLEEEDDDKFMFTHKITKNQNKFRVLTNKQNQEQRGHMESISEQNVTSIQSELGLVSSKISFDFSTGLEVTTSQQTKSVNLNDDTKQIQPLMEKSNELYQKQLKKQPERKPDLKIISTNLSFDTNSITNLNRNDITTQSSINESHVSLKSEPPQTPNGATQWVGVLLKGNSHYVHISRNVIVKPMGVRCKDTSTLEMISAHRELQLKFMLPQAYAEKLVDADDPFKYPMFSMNALEGHLMSKKNIEDENTLMKWNEITGVIWLDNKGEMCWLVFPNSQRTCTTLAISPRPQEKFIIITKRFSLKDQTFQTLTQLPPVDQLQSPMGSRYFNFNNKISYTTQLVIQSNDYYALPQICKNYSNFAIFGPKENFEVKEMIDACKDLGGNYVQEFLGDDIKLYDINLVLIHVQFLNQINYIPRLIELKRKSYCKFHLFGWDLSSPNPINLEEYFPNGCIVTITPKLLLSWGGDQHTIKGGEWYIKIHPLLRNYLEHTFNKYQNQDADEALSYLEDHFRKKSFTFFDNEELNFLQGSVCDESPFINKLHYMMTRYHNLHTKDLRHVIVIQDESEVDILCLPIQGVERMTLPEFQTIFGPPK
ncbi:11913_t:CDS:10 [Diversispora eburnea]|uniref:11913_t:CDS:1 n=1 Tax=Diversispora eburnea TaxID=1213867 RepID=A0A9N9BV58_9GLOM|nr:11913_t:CDS:10 [Diversispora eburnea]